MCKTHFLTALEIPIAMRNGNFDITIKKWFVSGGHASPSVIFLVFATYPPAPVSNAKRIQLVISAHHLPQSVNIVKQCL